MTPYERTKAWRLENPGCRAREYQSRKERSPEKLKEIGKRAKKRYFDKHRERLRREWAEDAMKRRRADPEGQKRRMEVFKARLTAKREAALGRSKPEYCELCFEPGYGRGNKPNAGICFDHDHKTGAARGWLCDRCNKVLGLVKDNTVLLESMVHYLERTSNDKTHNSAPQSAPRLEVCGA